MSDRMDDASLQEKIVGWLGEHGYPLEMRTARQFRGAGATVEVGRFYVDPESSEAREIDAIATFGSMAPSRPSDASVAVSFVCECKANTQPWVMFTRPALASELPLRGRVFHSRWSDLVDGLGGWVPARSAIDVTGQAAYGGVRALSKDIGNDPVYKAIQSATKAAYAFALEVHEATPTLVHIVFPVIVVGAPLFSCSLPDDGDDLEVKPIATGVPLRWARPLGGRSLTIVDVVVADQLDRYVKGCAAMADELVEAFKRHAG